eukprot:12891590-Prorocentrum_lima.AAC.1
MQKCTILSPLSTVASASLSTVILSGSKKCEPRYGVSSGCAFCILAFQSPYHGSGAFAYPCL